jgi:CRISPR/Cas system CSM-associated protein Csm3 (group 7 of RAMP superfamily)
VFGAPRIRSRLRFEDAVLEEPITDARTGVSLSRYRRTAYEERLFSTEVVWSKTLTARASGWLPGREEAAQTMALLWLAASMGSALGAARSRGLGRVTLEAFAAFCDGAPVQLDELRAVCERWQGERHG